MLTAHLWAGPALWPELGGGRAEGERLVAPRPGSGFRLWLGRSKLPELSTAGVLRVRSLS